MTKVARANQRMIYISDENKEVYDSLDNKAEWINEQLRKLRFDTLEEKGESEQHKFEERIRKMRANG